MSNGSHGTNDNQSFADALIGKIKEKKSCVCIGLDPNFESEKCIPRYLLENAANDHNEAIFNFNKIIIDNTFEFTPVYKPQSAFYEKYGAHDALERTIKYIHEKGCLTILDAKRNDIGNTSKAYAQTIFKGLEADSTTINGYLGTDCVKPFMDHRGKGLFILVKTSNKSSSEYQDAFSLNENLMRLLNSRVSSKIASVDQEQFIGIMDELIRKGTPTKGEICIRNYILMARLVRKWSDEWKREWNAETETETETETDTETKAKTIAKAKAKAKYNYTDIGAVVGATYPEQLKTIRKEIPESFFLIPGYGAQGGKADDIINGFNPDGLGAVINSSRGIDYAYAKEIDGRKFAPEEFGEAAGLAARTMRDDINGILNKNGLLPW